MIRRPDSIFVRAGSILTTRGSLFRSEHDLVSGAVPARRREIVAGRVLARRLMVDMGVPEQGIGQHPNGAPIWPVGLCGSIAHTFSQIAVAVARTSQLQSLGIDIDDGRNLGTATSQVGLRDEIKSLAAHPLARDEASAVRLLFSTKEALFKCQSPVTKNDSLSFMDVRLTLTEDGLTAKPNANVAVATASLIKRMKLLIEVVQGVTIAFAWIEKNGEDNV